MYIYTSIFYVCVHIYMHKCAHAPYDAHTGTMADRCDFSERYSRSDRYPRTVGGNDQQKSINVEGHECQGNECESSMSAARMGYCPGVAPAGPGNETGIEHTPCLQCAAARSGVECIPHFLTWKSETNAAATAIADAVLQNEGIRDG